MLLRVEGHQGAGSRCRGRHRDGDERGERRVLHLHGGRYHQETDFHSGRIFTRKKWVSLKNAESNTYFTNIL